MYGLGSEDRPRSRTSTRILRVGVLFGVLAWIVFIVLRIHGEPDPGAGSPAELARAYEAGLNDRDADRVARLLGTPISGDADDVAKFLVGQEHDGRWHVTVGGADSQASVAGTHLTVSDDRQARAQLGIEEQDGRWRVNPIATG